jgi:hypothetical protein
MLKTEHNKNIAIRRLFGHRQSPCGRFEFRRNRSGFLA